MSDQNIIGEPEIIARDIDALHEATNYAEAFDRAVKGLVKYPADRELRYLSVLSLARMGAVEQARSLHDKYDIPSQGTPKALSLAPRLVKDLALELPDHLRDVKLHEAAEGYLAAFDKTGSPFPGINSAAIYAWIGDVEKAREISRRIVQDKELSVLDPVTGGGIKFWDAATLTEAWFILGDMAKTEAWANRAAGVANGNQSLLSTVSRSLKRTAAALGSDPCWLKQLKPATVIHYCGHIMAARGKRGRFEPRQEDEVRAEINAKLERLKVGFAYGSLAAGADILIAEEVLRRGGSLHVVLPFRKKEFIEKSVKPSGQRWVKRFHACLRHENAAKPIFATDHGHQEDDTLFTYASRIAMGLAVLRGRQLDTTVEQIAVWDGQPSAGLAGTALDVDFWERSVRESVLVEIEPSKQETEARTRRRTRLDAKRRARAMLFADAKGFSKLEDHQLPLFVKHVVGAWTDVIARHHGTVLFANSWGDALYPVFRRASDAADCALDLQEAMRKLREDETIDLPKELTLRIGGHLGPVYSSHDPILGRTNFFGAHVSRAARVEPATPPGFVYVTEPFAASLALDPDRAFIADYVGVTKAAKKYGAMPMYLLRRRATGPLE